MIKTSTSKSNDLYLINRGVTSVQTSSQTVVNSEGMILHISSFAKLRLMNSPLERTRGVENLHYEVHAAIRNYRLCEIRCATRKKQPMLVSVT
jgi:hypothetical protein